MYSLVFRSNIAIVIASHPWLLLLDSEKYKARSVSGLIACQALFAPKLETNEIKQRKFRLNSLIKQDSNEM